MIQIADDLRIRNYGFFNIADEKFSARLKCEGFSVDMRSTQINSDRKIKIMLKSAIPRNNSFSIFEGL